MTALMDCSGCGVLIPDYCYFVANHSISSCPCMDCLVKPMCNQKNTCDLRTRAMVVTSRQVVLFGEERMNEK